jgi:hypothetical protein
MMSLRVQFEHDNHLHPDCQWHRRVYLRPPDPTEYLTGIPQQVHVDQWSSGMYNPVVGEWKVQSS